MMEIRGTFSGGSGSVLFPLSTLIRLSPLYRTFLLWLEIVHLYIYTLYL